MLKFFGVDQLIFFSIYAENASLYSYADQNDRSMLGAVSEVVRNLLITDFLLIFKLETPTAIF